MFDRPISFALGGAAGGEGKEGGKGGGREEKRKGSPLLDLLFGTRGEKGKREGVSSFPPWNSGLAYSGNKNILCSMTCGWVLKKEQQGGSLSKLNLHWEIKWFFLFYSLILHSKLKIGRDPPLLTERQGSLPKLNWQWKKKWFFLSNYLCTTNSK